MKPKNLNWGEEQAIKQAQDVGLSDVPCIAALLACIERLDDELQRESQAKLHAEGDVETLNERIADMEAELRDAREEAAR